MHNINGEEESKTAGGIEFEIVPPSTDYQQTLFGKLKRGDRKLKVI